ncbi:MAG TPA: hypothetical protein VNK95_02420, partial [Caldilineaceae bacterium]|nr:hypothetical protein [Caldilineaceae bacterium]
MSGGGWALLRMGGVHAVRWLTVLYLVVAVPLLFLAHTVYDAALVAFIMLAPLTGLLMRRKTALSLGIMTVFALCALFLLGAFGYLQPKAAVQLGPAELLILLVGLLLNTAFVHTFWAAGPDRREDEREHKREEVQNMAAALAATTRELEATQTLLRQTRDQLDQLVVERTADLAEANRQLVAEVWERQQSEARFRHLYEDTLRLAKQNAEAAARAKSEFLANMSH